MMDCDLLLSWMTHLGEGSWARFRSAVEELAGADVDLDGLCRRLRISFSDLGFADFFVDDTQQWRMLPPVLGGLSGQDGAVLCGSRTPILVESLKTAVGVYGCEVYTEKPADCPTLIRVTGGVERLAETAKQMNVSFHPNLAAAVSWELTTIPERMESAAYEPAPLNWKVRSFDFRTCMWVDKLLPNSACEYAPTYGRPKYFVHRRRGRLQRVSKRESLYAAALLKGVRLVEFDAAGMRLKVPLFAPLPELYSRALCLCSGRLAAVVNGRITYGGVPPDLAAVVMVAAGQPHPGVDYPAGTGRCFNE